jgi:chemotaxis protein histidine kinase CheA
MSKMPKMPSLSYKPKPKNFDFSNEFEDVLNKIVSTKITDPSDPDENDYKPIRDLLEQFYTMKFNDTIKLLVKLFDNLKILMTKHSGDKEYYKVINIETFYKNAIEESDLEDIKTKDESFISKITSSINTISFNPNSKSIYSNLYCSLLIIHYYPIVILDTIFLNAQTNISRLKTNIPKLKEDNYTQQINSITTEINQSEAAAAAAAAATAAAADDAAAATAAADAAAAAADAAAADAKNKTLADGAADAAIAAAKLAGEAASSAIIEAEQACNLITSAIRRSEAVFGTRPTDVTIIRTNANALDKVGNARNKIAQLRDKSRAAIDAAAAITDAKVNNPLNLDQFTSNAQLPINEVNALVKTTREDANALRELLVAIEPSPDTIAAPNRFFGFFGGSNTSDDTMVGGEDTDDDHDIKNTLTIINDVLDETDKTGSLIKYSTEIFYKALTILSISIGLPIDFNSKNIIVDQIKNLVNDEVIQKFALSSSPPAAAATPPATPATPAADPATPAADPATPAPDPAAAAPDPAAAAAAPDAAAADAAAATPPVGVDHGAGVGVGVTPPPPDPGAGVVAATPPPVGAAVGGVVLIDQEIKKSIKLIFNSAASNYTYFGEIIDDIFYNFYNSSQKKLAKTLKDAQENDTQKKNQLKELKLNVKKANLAVHNAEVTKMSADKKIKAADDARRASNAARHAAFITSKTTVAKARALTSLQDAVAAASDIHTAQAEYDEAVESAAAADAAADAASAAADAAAAAAADAPAAFKAANDALDIANKAVEGETLKLTTAEKDYTTSPVNTARTDLLNALYDKKDKKDKKEQKKDPKPTIKNMKSAIDAEILTHFEGIFAPPDSASKSKTGGQKTQKNRYRGGIRKNINSIDSFDSIDSDL